MSFLVENIIGIQVLSISLPVSIFTIEPNTAVTKQIKHKIMENIKTKRKLDYYWLSNSAGSLKSLR